MPSTCPTVRVVSPSSPGGYKIINESDLTKDHEIWDGEPKAEQTASQDKQPASLNLKQPTLANPVVAKHGGQHSPQNRS